MRLAHVLRDDALREKFLTELKVRGFAAFRRLVHERRGDMDRVLYVEICRVLEEEPLPPPDGGTQR